MVKFTVIVTDRMSLVIVIIILIVTDRVSLVIVKFEVISPGARAPPPFLPKMVPFLYERNQILIIFVGS